MYPKEHPALLEKANEKFTATSIHVINGDHTVRSAVAENPMLHANITA